MTSADVTLTDAEASNPIIKVSGTLTANVNLILPVTAKRIYAVWNATSGAFTLTVKTPAGAGVTVAQGKRNLVYTDGSTVQDAFNDFESIALTGVPTAPTAAAGTNTTQLATTAFFYAALNAEFASLKASSGYTKLPNDLILQWGTFSTPATAGADVTVTFPIAFPNACLSAGCTSEAEQAIGIAAFTKTNVTVSKGVSDPYARSGYWYSIGH